MAKIIRLTESDLVRLVNRVIEEQLDTDYQNKVQSASVTADNSPEGKRLFNKKIQDMNKIATDYGNRPRFRDFDPNAKKKDYADKTAKKLRDMIRKDGMTDEKMLSDFYKTIRSIMLEVPKTRIEDVWNRNVTKNSLRKVLPTWEGLVALQGSNKNRAIVQKSFSRMGVTDNDFLNKIGSLVQSNSYDSKRKELGLNNIPSSQTITAIVSLALQKNLFK